MFATQVETVDRLNARYDAYLEKTGQAPLKEAMFALPADADLTTEEFTILRTGLRAPAAESIETVAVRDEEYEPSLGQTDTKYQTRIRNQGSCGSCWAFSAVASLEKLYYDINRVQADLSQQYLVDCSTVDNGCSGGWPANTYTWIASFDLTFESSYPYKGVRGYCRRSEVPLAKLAGNVVSKTLPWGINTAVRVTNAGVNAGLQVYASGAFRFVNKNDDIFDARFSNECANSINHAVNLVSATSDYAVVQNSWGTTWGNQGVKKIRPCNDYVLLGSPSYITHTYSNV